MLKPTFLKGIPEAGCDEAGRGCLAGPVYAAAVILPKNFRCKWLNDSKQLTAAVRNELRPVIESKALAWAVAKVDADEIDSINIYRAAMKAMHLAIAALQQKPELLLIDGNRFVPFPGIEHHCVIGGDGIYKHIAAASILAKTHRDEFMLDLHRQYPEYGWDENKGYATAHHRRLVTQLGPTPFHRRSFRLNYEVTANPEAYCANPQNAEPADLFTT